MNTPSTKETNKRLRLLVTPMALTVIIAALVSIWALYSAELNEQKERLHDSVTTQQDLILLLAQTQNIQLPSDDEAKLLLSQIGTAYSRRHSLDSSFQQFIARQRNDQTEILRHYQNGQLNMSEGLLGDRARLPLLSDSGEPFELAWQGHTGVMIGLDHHGTKVLAAYGVIELGEIRWGLVSQVDLIELQAPYIKTIIIYCINDK